MSLITEKQTFTAGSNKLYEYNVGCVKYKTSLEKIWALLINRRSILLL